ncbi:MAG: PLP-dependent enzyme histidinol-phosphate/aromatic aminotransferase or cobyric acid decarboxylase [Planctomycetota bacterium]|nr:PLP-dependent enzyme histidinol-phosphate/aromatic aminotransferase or cobyric acid decarboxylase [Planctomycetota bacterium]
MTSSPIQHGGNQYGIRRRLGLADRPLMDFSVSLNPLGPPPTVLAAARAAIDRSGEYPEPGCPRLTAKLAARHNVPEDRIIIGAGTSEIISLVAQSLREVLALHARELGDPKVPLAHLIEPTYGEYRRASSLNELRTEIWRKPTMGWDLDFLPKSASGIYWTGNPISPVGRAWDRETLLRKVDDAQALLVVVDEAYLPFFADEAARTVTTAAGSRTNLLALRSVTKIYAMPGIRVGYAVTSADMVARLKQYQNPWSVDSPSEAALLAALDDDEYLERSIELIESESAWLTDRLWDLQGVRPVWPGRERPEGAPPRPNWVLVSLVDTNWTSIQVHEELARRGVLVRECSNFSGLQPGGIVTGPNGLEIPTQGHLRFAVRTKPENDKLVSILSDILAGKPPVAEPRAAHASHGHATSVAVSGKK